MYIIKSVYVRCSKNGKAESLMKQKHLLNILIVSPGCDHSFSNQLLKVKWQHIQVTQHPDTHTMLLQIFPTEGDKGKAFIGKEKNKKA